MGGLTIGVPFIGKDFTKFQFKKYDFKLSKRYYFMKKMAQISPNSKEKKSQFAKFSR
jgi:uncharacterized ubiquitin-like protein YukD